MLPSNFKILFNESEIARAVATMGAEIDRWAESVWASSHTDILTIPILRGGLFFYADLVRKVHHSIEMAPVRTWAYNADDNSQRSEVKAHLADVPAKGRSVLLVDDVCDSGKTLRHLTNSLLAVGAIEVRSAVIVKRVVEGETFDPEYVGFSHRGDEWFVGYGMDDCDRWRNLSCICAIKQ